jgi:hypothetical protein
MFNWECVPSAVKYQLQVADNEWFKEPVIDVYTDISEYWTPVPLRSGKWFWRIGWQDAFGSWSDWSSTSSFFTDSGSQELPDIPSDREVDAGGAMCYVKASSRDSTEALYVLVGNESRQVWRFNISSGFQWQLLCTLAFDELPGASITSYSNWGSGYVLSALLGMRNPMQMLLIHGGQGTTYWPPRSCPYGSAIVRNDDDYNLVLVIAGEYDTTNFYKWIPPLEEGPMANTSEHNLNLQFSREGKNVHLFYRLDEARPVRASVFDHSGRLVKRLFSGVQSAGGHDLRCELNSLGTGIYFLRLDIGGKTATMKLSVW